MMLLTSINGFFNKICYNDYDHTIVMIMLYMYLFDLLEMEYIVYIMCLHVLVELSVVVQ